MPDIDYSGELSKDQECEQVQGQCYGTPEPMGISSILDIWHDCIEHDGYITTQMVQTRTCNVS